MIWFSWSGPRQKTNYALLLLTSTTFTPPSNSHHLIQQHLLLFSTSQVSPSQLGKVETDLYTKPTDKIRNEPFHSVSLSDYDAYGLQTKASHYAPVNSSNTLTDDRGYNSLFSKKKSNEFTQSLAIKHTNPVRLPQTNPVASRLSSHTILPFVPYQVSYLDTLKSFRLSHAATTFFKLHIVLLSDEPTTWHFS